MFSGTKQGQYICLIGFLIKIQTFNTLETIDLLQMWAQQCSSSKQYTRTCVKQNKVFVVLNSTLLLNINYIKYPDLPEICMYLSIGLSVI